MIRWTEIVGLCLAFALMPIIVIIGQMLGLPR